jgi:hypothetical protein
MDIEFSQFRNQQARLSNHSLELSGNRLPFHDVLNFGDSLGKVSVRSIVQALEEYTKITHGDCQPQLALLIFTATGNQRALDFYFPMTQMFTALEIEHFYQFVDSVAQHPNLDLHFIGENRTNLTAQTPLGIRYLVAGHIAEVFFHRRDIFERFFAAPRHFHLYATPRAFAQDEGVAGGDYNPQHERIQLVVARLFEGFFGQTAGVCPFLHEFGHMLDHFDAGTGKMGLSEGLLPGLSPRDGTIFSPRARALFIAGKRLEIERYLARYQGVAQQTDPLPIGHPYVFQNDGEFIAGYLEMFFRNPNYFASQNQDLYMSFVEIFQCDPRNAWLQDFPFYINQNRNFYLSRQQPWAPNLSVPND